HLTRSPLSLVVRRNQFPRARAVTALAQALSVRASSAAAGQRRASLGRTKRMNQRKPVLRIAQVLSWADHHHARTGKYPNAESGAVRVEPTENWGAINQALLAGLRGLPGKDSLARLLLRERGRPHRHNLPALTEDDILAWAREHHARTGTWPMQTSGLIEG